MHKSKFDVFLSHNSADKPAVDELARRLDEKGIKPWLDNWNLIPGAPWQEAIEEALDACASCAVIIGPSGIGPWQNEEMRAAIDHRVHKHDFRVIPVVLPGGQRDRRSHLPTFLVQTTWVEFHHTLDDEAALHLLICGIRGIEPGSDAAPLEYEGLSPYRGLQVFQPEHASFFFGREALTGWLLEVLRPRSTSHLENRFLAVVGPSGSGKSSLIRAGLIPALRAGKFRGSDKWPIVVCRPGRDPLVSLAKAMSTDSTMRKVLAEVEDTVASLGADERRLHVVAHLALQDHSKEQRLVLVVDQFEELFTMCRDESLRKALIDNLMYTSTVVGGRVIVVVTMRADFYGKCAAHPSLAAAMSEHQVLVGAMTEHELRRAIERPAQLVGCELEKGLTELLLQDVKNEAGALPLLEHALMELWERREGRRLTIAAYREIGEIEGALEQYANTVFDRLSTEEQEICKHVFLRLTQPGEGTEDTKRRVAREDLEESAAVAPVLQQLITARLVTAEGEAQATDNGRQVFIEVSHEALIRGWSKLRDWIDTDRDMVRLEHRLSAAAREWRHAGKDPAFLYRGVRLAEAEAWARSHSKEVVTKEREFLAASIALRNEEQQAKEQQHRHELAMARQLADTERRAATRLRRRAWYLGVAGAIALFTAVASVHSYLDARMAEQSATAELVKRLWRRAITERDLNGDWLKASHYLMEAAQRTNEHAGAVNAYLAGSLLVRRMSLEDIWPHGQNVRGASMSADERWILTWSDDHTARLWDRRSGEQLAKLTHGLKVLGAVFSKDEQRILTWSKDGTVALWGTESGKQQASVVHPGVRGARLSPDEGRVLTWSKDGKAFVWNLSTREVLTRLSHTDLIHGALFSQDKPQILTWSTDGTAKLWDANTGETLVTFEHQRALWGATFSRDERRVLTWSFDSTARLWETASGKPLRLLQHEAPVWGGRFSRSQVKILTWSDNGAVTLWNSENGQKLSVMRHDGPVRGAAFSPDEAWILSWGDDTTARLWDAANGQLLRLFQHSDSVRGARLSPDRQLVLTWSGNAARVWAIRSKQRLMPALRHGAPITQALFADNGNQVLTASQDGTLRIWRIQNMMPAELPMRHESSVRAALYRPDVGQVLSWSIDGTLWTWKRAQVDEGFDKRKLSGRFNGARFSQDGSKLLTWSADGDTRLWSTRSGEQLIPSMPHGSCVLGAVFDPDEQVILSWSEDGIARIWDSLTGELIASQEHEGRVAGAVFGPNGHQVLTWSAYGQGWLWNSGQPQEKKQLKDVESVKHMSAAVFTTAGKRVLMLGRDGTGRFLDTLSGEVTKSFDLHNGRINGAVFSQTGSRVLTWSDDRTARLWDLDAQKMLLPPLLHGSKVRGATFNADETRVLTWTSDGTARVWDSNNGRPLTPTMKHEYHRPINGARFITDDKGVMTWGADNTVRLWSLEVDESGLEKPVLNNQIRTGTLLAEDALEIISREDWLLIKRRYGE